MEKKCISIQMKDPNGKPFQTSVPITEDPTEEKMIKVGTDIAEQFNRSKRIIIEFQVFNSISDTWMTMSSYYADEKRLVKH